VQHGAATALEQTMPYWLFRPIAWVVFHLVYILCGGIRFEGRENVPLTGGVLITPNHISDADPPTVAIALPRDCWVMAKQEIMDMKIIGPISRWLHGFPVKRYTADRKALKRAEDLLKSGEAVLIFPEGKISENAKLQPILPGVLLVARAANVPIVPTIIIGTELIIPYCKMVPRPSWRKTIVRFGPPVTVGQLTGNVKGGEALRKGAEKLYEILLALQQGLPYPELATEKLNAIPESGEADDAKEDTVENPEVNPEEGAAAGTC
jgi:1-acyl-sn-glycerol-3-phosphate acyltransferase